MPVNKVKLGVDSVDEQGHNLFTETKQPKEITKMNFIKTIAKLFGHNQQTQFQKYMKQAREMMKIAREDKALGYLSAAQAAVQSAKSYRAAAHASVYYSV